MSRKYEFRVYSFLDKSFHYFDVYDYPQGIAGTVSEPQRYTGLKDKNNIEVYEGDIVEWGNLNYLVEWNHNAYKWQGRCPYYHRYHHPTTENFRDLIGGSIVGNIFELPCDKPNAFDHNGECLICDSWAPDCQFRKKKKSD